LCLALAAALPAALLAEEEPPGCPLAAAADELDTEGPDAEGLFPRFADNALVLCINARIMEGDRAPSWNEARRKVTIPGQPVEIKLLGTNVVVAVLLTPYLRRDGSGFLVAHGQIWMETPDRGIRYHASMQTVPVSFGEPIHFFPLGPARGDAASIEVIVTMYRHDD